MSEIEWTGGVQQSEAFQAALSRYPYGDIVRRTLIWAVVAGVSTMLAIVLALGDVSFYAYFLAFGISAALVGLVVAASGLVIATAVWATLALFRLDVRTRATAAAIVPVVAVLGVWVWLIGLFGADAFFTPMISIALVVTAVVLAEAMRRRFLAAIDESAARSAGPSDETAS